MRNPASDLELSRRSEQPAFAETNLIAEVQRIRQDL